MEQLSLSYYLMVVVAVALSVIQTVKEHQPWSLKS